MVASCIVFFAADVDAFFASLVTAAMVASCINVKYSSCDRRQTSENNPIHRICEIWETRETAEERGLTKSV
jgi:hypothetical protein